MSMTGGPLRVIAFPISKEVSETTARQQLTTASANSIPRSHATHKWVQKSSHHNSTSPRPESPHRTSSKLPTFTLFPRLPPEVRNMIWLHSVSPRIITINHNLPRDSYLLTEPKRSDLVRRRDIEEQYPALLYVCKESRSLVLPLYTSIFPTPQFGPLKWHYTGSRRPLYLTSIQKQLGVELPDTQNTAPKDLVKAFETTMNAHLATLATIQPYKTFATFYRKPKGTVCPAFFNPSLDTIYIRRSPPPLHFVKGRFLTGLWSPKKHLQAHAIRHLAIELDNLTYPGPHCGQSHTRRWCNQFATTYLTGLESLSLVCLEDHEVITFTLDTTGLLREKQWSYSLSLAPPSDVDFATQMQDKKIVITWNVHLVSVQGKALWKLVKTWRPVWDQWEDEKRSICEGLEGKEADMIGREWWNAKRVHGFYRMLRKPQLVVGGDGKIWLGKSRPGR